MGRFSPARLKGSTVSKFLAISLPLVLTSTLIVFSVFGYQTHSVMQDQLEVELDSLVSTQAEALSLPVWNYDTDSIALTLQAVLTNEKVTAIRLRDSNGATLIEQGDLANLAEERLVASRDIRRIDDQGDRVIGSLEIAMTDVALRDATTRRAFNAAFTALLLVIAVTVATLLAYYKAVGTPLDLLYRAIQSRRTDGKRITIDWHEENEVGAVISSFNQMQEQQESYESELREAQESLERRIKERTRELEESRRVAQHATAAKSDFLSTMSHEIRTPLNGVVGMTHLLMDTELDPEQRDMTKVISNSADALLHIISDILDFSKIEAGKLELEQTPFNLRECIEGSLDLVSVAAADKALNLAYTIDIAVPETVIGDGARLRQILLNLLSNAVKFTDSGEVVLAVKVENLDGHLKFSVSDTGMGIAADSQDRLFKSFSQVDVSTTRKHGGTGLGLVISKHIVELMNGSIWLESQLGEGTTFYFTAEMKGTNGASAITGSHDLYNLKGKNVLIVESNVTNQKVLRQQLSAWSMHPTISSSAEASLEIVNRDEHFDLCIIDLHLPGASGVRLGCQIRATTAGTDLPIIFTSVFGKSASDREELDALGPIAMLNKPLKHSALFDAVFKALVGEDNLSTHKTSLFDNGHSAGAAEQFPMEILLVDDNETNRKLGRMLLRRLGYTIDIVESGADAIRAIADKKYDLVLMDIEMPDMDGFETTSKIRSDHSPKSLQIVAMTANTLQGMRKRCLDAGMNDYVAKPIRPDLLLKALVSSYEALQKSEDPIEAATQNSDDSTINQGTIADLLSMIGGATESLHELIDSFLGDAPALLESMSLGLKEDNPDTIRRAAHTLKSSAVDFGAERLSEMARMLEEKSTAKNLNGVRRDIELIRTEYDRASKVLLHIRSGSN